MALPTTREAQVDLIVLKLDISEIGFMDRSRTLSGGTKEHY